MGFFKLPKEATLWQRRDLFTQRLVWTMLFVSLSALNFGFDLSLFSSIQSMDSFDREFGVYSELQQQYILPPYLSSIMNSTPYLGKLIGTLTCGFLMERFGRKAALLAISCFSLVGVTLQTSAFSAAQYAVGRVVTYIAIGYAINVVPAYESECSPAELRGAISSTIQIWIGIGQVLGGAITFGTSGMTSRAAWLIPTGLQYVLPVIILIGLPFIPESPRWLLAKDRKDEAVKALLSLRPKGTHIEDVEHELNLLALAEQAHGKGPWKDLFKGINKRRTSIAIGAMVGQQITGQSFVGQYSVVFYKLQKITHPSPFLLGLIQSLAGLVSVFIAVFLVDGFGRRPVLLLGSFLMTLWLFLVGGMGEIKTPTAVQKNFLVACVQLFGISYGFSWGALSYVVMSEAPSGRLREKTVLIATSTSAILTFLITFTLPYLLNAPYAALGPKVGFVYGSFCAATLVVTYLFVPEMKNRSLEEIDEMFEAKLPARKFGTYVSNGLGRQIVDAEEMNASVKRSRKEVHEQFEKIEANV